jgi:hypothetical protein
VAVLVPVLVSQLGAPDRSQPDGPDDISDSPALVSEPMHPVGDVPLKARVTMESVTWGTRVGLTSTYDRWAMDKRLPPSMDYTLCVRDWDGHTEKVGSWRSVDGMTMEVSGATSMTQDDISSVQVRAPDGRVVLRLPK